MYFFYCISWNKEAAREGSNGIGIVYAKDFAEAYNTLMSEYGDFSIRAISLKSLNHACRSIELDVLNSAIKEFNASRAIDAFASPLSKPTPHFS